MTQEAILAEAKFNPRVQTYWLLSGTVLCVATIVGILLLPLWLVLGRYFTGRYLQHMSCVLTDRSLKVGRGMFVRQEKTVPLDKITDLALIEGPIMRYLDLQAIKVETAGGSPGAFIQLVGIVEARSFRDTVLKQRDAVVSSGHSPVEIEAAAPVHSDQVLVEIRDSLLRIEERLADHDRSPQ